MRRRDHAVRARPADLRRRPRQALTDTADVLETIEAQTLVLMNRGVPLDRVQAYEVEVPERSRQLPYLQPVYDHPQFLVRNVWRRYGGWYDGEPDNLLPPRAEQAREWVTLAGGLEGALGRARQLAAAGDHRLACHLVEFAVLFEPGSTEAHQVRAEAYAAPAARAGVVDGPTSSVTPPTPAAKAAMTWPATTTRNAACLRPTACRANMSTMTPDEAGLVFIDPVAYADEARFHQAWRCCARRIPSTGWRPGVRPVLRDHQARRRAGDRAAQQGVGERPAPVISNRAGDAHREANGELLRTLIHMDDPDHRAYRASRPTGSSPRTWPARRPAGRAGQAVRRQDGRAR